MLRGHRVTLGIELAGHPDMLSEGTDYLYYKHAYHTGGAITGLKNSEVSVVATKKYLVIVPQREVSLTPTLAVRVKTMGSKVQIQQALEQLLAEPLTLDELEAALRELVPAENVVAVDTLKKLSVWMFFRQVRFKAERGATQVLALKGRENHERFKTFYAAALR
jgi:hypothetical protein